MKVEKLNDGSLFKILKVIYNDLDKLDDITSGRGDTLPKIKEMLNNLGIEQEMLNIQYIYVCLKDNWDILDENRLTSPLNRPKLKKYSVDIDVRVIKNCNESYTQIIHSYESDEDSIAMIVNDEVTNNPFWPTEGKFNGEICDFSETEEWEIADINYLKS